MKNVYTNEVHKHALIENKNKCKKYGNFYRLSACRQVTHKVLYTNLPSPITRIRKSWSSMPSTALSSWSTAVEFHDLQFVTASISNNVTN